MNNKLLEFCSFIHYKMAQNSSSSLKIVPISFAGDGNINVKLISTTPNPEGVLLYAARVSSENQNSGTVGLIDYLLRNKHVSPFEIPELIFEFDGFPRTIVRQCVRHKSNMWTVYDVEGKGLYNVEDKAHEDLMATGKYQDVALYDIRQYEFPFFHMPETNVQEHSYRYAHGKALCEPKSLITNARLQHPKDRQRSIEITDIDECQKWYPDLSKSDLAELNTFWMEGQEKIIEDTYSFYQKCLSKHLANELSRNVLPEGLAPTKLVVKFNLRSFITFQLDRNPNFGTGYTAQKEIQYLADLMFIAAKEVIPNVCQSLIQHHGAQLPSPTKKQTYTMDQMRAAYRSKSLTDDMMEGFFNEEEKKPNTYKRVTNPFVIMHQ
jgi:thymidylate synthase ThyX